MTVASIKITTYVLRLESQKVVLLTLYQSIQLKAILALTRHKQEMQEGLNCPLKTNKLHAKSVNYRGLSFLQIGH